MVEGWTSHDVSRPDFRHRNVNDRVEHERVYLTGGAGSLRGLQCRRFQRQVIELEVEAQAEILVGVARNACGAHTASSADKLLCRSARQVRAAANVKGPILVVVSLCL